VSEAPGSTTRLRRLTAELAKFGTVGVVAYVVDVGTYNLLVFGGGEGPLHDKPLTAKTIAGVLATLVAYGGNRQWTFRDRDRRGVLREYAMFLGVNAVALGITLLPLAVSRYVLDLRGPLADNISANIFGVALGTLFRFVAYRTWVFPHPEASADGAVDRSEEQRERGG
jgi:putative flippase GtrA